MTGLGCIFCSIRVAMVYCNRIGLIFFLLIQLPGVYAWIYSKEEGRAGE